jgi:hypothetical protein
LYLWNTDYSQQEQFPALAYYLRLYLAVFAGCSWLLFHLLQPRESEDFRDERRLSGCFFAAFNSDNSQQHKGKATP